MWSHMARIVGEVGPRFVFVENSPVLTSRGLGTVLGDLASLGYDAEWTVLGAADVGAPHQRDRIWILAHTDVKRAHAGEPQQERGSFCDKFGDGPPQERGWHHIESRAHRRGDDLAYADCPGLAEREGQRGDHAQKLQAPERGGLSEGGGWWASEPALGRVANGVAHRVDRLSAIGNGQVPAVAALAWRVLSDRILTRP